MARQLYMLILVLAFGCSSKSSRSVPIPANARMLHKIQAIAAEQLGKTVQEMNPDSPFSALGADDLDVVEITMATEDALKIAIADDELFRVAGIPRDGDLVNRLTLRKFATVAVAAPKQKNKEDLPHDDSADGTLRESQVGMYGELCKLPNPNGYVLVFIPSLDLIVRHSEQKLSRKLNDAELAAIKERAAVIALPLEIAKEVTRKQAERATADAIPVDNS